MATRKLPKGATTKRPSSRAYANNRAVIDNLVAPEKVPANYPSTMSGNRDVQRQAFAQEKTGVSKNYKMVNGKLTEISEDEWKQAAKKFAASEKKIPKGTSLNQVKAARLSKLKSAAVKVQGTEKTLNANDGLSTAERKMAREGNAPARAPASRSTPAPASVAEAPKAPATSAAPKMSRAQRSAANKAKHKEVRAAEEKKWAEQKSAKTGKTAAPAKPKATAVKPAAKTMAAKPAAPAKTATAKPAATKPVATKATPAPKAKAAPKAKPATSKPKINPERAARMSVKPVPKEGAAAPATPKPMAAKPAPQSWMAKNLPNVSTVIKEGLVSKAGRQAAVSAGKNLGAGLLSRGNVLVTGLTYSKDAGNKAADDAVGARLQAAVRQGRRDAAAAKPAAATAKPAQTKAAAPVQRKASAAPAKSPVQKAATTAAPAKAIEVAKANPDKAIADFEAKLKGAGVVSIAGGANGKAQMVGQPMSVTQLQDQFTRKKGPR